MSHADSQSSSTSAGGEQYQPPVPPAPPRPRTKSSAAPDPVTAEPPRPDDAATGTPQPPPPGGTKPPPPPQTSPPPVAGPAPPTAAPSSQPSSHVVPPPPPPRSVPLPPRRAPETKRPASGVGSAKGGRWRGELETVPRASSADHTHAASSPASGDNEPLEIDREDVTRSAPPWLISTILHLILLLILALISSPVGEGLSRIALEIGESLEDDSVALEEFSVSQESSLSELSESTEDAPVDLDLPTLFEPVEELEINPLEMGSAPSVTDATPMFGGRSGAMKQALMARYGATPQTQDAVARGLAWLKRNQERAGSWSMKGPYSDPSMAENRIAATAMALLAFLGDGNTHLSGEYSKEVEAGLKFLVKRQRRDGRFHEPNGRNDENAYAQAQATIAICEAYAMTKDSWLRAPAQAALDFAAAAQSEEGGWRYQPRFDSDTSVTGWYVMALQSGISADLDVNHATLHNVTYYLDSVQGYDGAAYSYKRGRPMSDAMTAEGLLCRQYLGWSKTHLPMIQGVETLAYDYNFDPDDRNVYYWYYATQVLHHYGGSPWREWNSVMRRELPKMQIERGREEGSWAPQQDHWGKSAGRLYTTCLSIYCLEVYYRHLPLYSFGKQADPPERLREEPSP